MTFSAVVFGGTFDPVHLGHTAVAAQVRDAMQADEVWFVPAAVPYLHAPPGAPPGDRLAMLQLALGVQSWCRTLDIELARGGVSYTVDTMRELHAQHPDAQLPLLLGADAARGIRAWNRFEELLARETFIVINRAGADAVDAPQLAQLGYNPERLAVLQVDSPPISATLVRERAAALLPLDGLVAHAVAAYIAEHRLYTAEQPVHNAAG